MIEQGRASERMSIRDRVMTQHRALPARPDGWPRIGHVAWAEIVNRF